MQPENILDTTCIAQNKPCLEIGENMPEKANIVGQNIPEEANKISENMPEGANKHSQTEARNTEIVKVVDNPVTCNQLRIEDCQRKKSEACEKTPVKYIRKEEAIAHKKVHFATGEYVCSKKCETIQLQIEDCQSKKSEASEKTPIKGIGREEVIEHKKVHFATGKYVCSKKCETLHVNLEQLPNLSSRSSPVNSSRNQSSILSDKVYFFCVNLNDAGIASAKFSMVISFVLLYVSIQYFFKNSDDDEDYDVDEGYIKILAFFAGVYALCYVHCARKLISGIRKELKHKLIAWIGFSIMTTLFLFSHAFYILISNWDELSDFHKDLLSNCQTVALIITLAIIGCILVYCTRVVLLLWKSMHFQEETQNGSLVKLLRDFGAIHVFSLNSFSHHAAH